MRALWLAIEEGHVMVAVFSVSILALGLADAAESWRVSEQPGLKDALERAPLLRTESLGEPARGVNVWERWMVPNPDGKTWDVLQIYFNE